jgi:hypothetical protein
MTVALDTRQLKEASGAQKALLPALLFGVRLWASVWLALCVARRAL